MLGHYQVTDGYLLGLAINKKARLATLDEGLASLLDAKSGYLDRIVVIPRNL
jgi:hypothetical protein